MATLAVTRRLDLTDEQWARLEPLLPVPTRSGRPSEWTKRQLIDGIRWRVRAGAWAQIVTALQPRADAAGLGLAEMARVTRREGIIAACVWITPSCRHPQGSSHGVVHRSWATRDGGGASLRCRRASELRGEVGAVHPGVGPAGADVVSRSHEEQVALGEHCRDALPAPFVLTARAWAARGPV